MRSPPIQHQPFVQQKSIDDQFKADSEANKKSLTPAEYKVWHDKDIFKTKAPRVSTPSHCHFCGCALPALVREVAWQGDTQDQESQGKHPLSLALVQM